MTMTDGLNVLELKIAKVAIIVAVCLATGACSVRQPESAQTVAALEVPLPTEAERAEFLELLQQQAKADGLHVDAASKQELRESAEVDPDSASTIRAGVWRGDKDDDLEGSVMNMDQPGLVWITFLKGEHPELATRFRERVMATITKRWPETHSLPIMPTGSIPLHHDMVLTRGGYRVKSEAAADYGLSPRSPLIAAR